MKSVFLAITGASGSCYGYRLLQELLSLKIEVQLCISANGKLVCKEELGIDLPGQGVMALSQRLTDAGTDTGMLNFADPGDLCHVGASGSSAPEAMIVAPCSMGTLGRIAAGISSNLIERTADVMLKEGRPLLILPRETPFNIIHLENMLRVARAGARIIPAMPAFYNHPEQIEDMVNFVAGKVLDQIAIPHCLYKRWDGSHR